MNTSERSPARVKRVNLVIPMALIIPIALWGFWLTYYGTLNNLPETVTSTIHIHAALMMLWLVMMVAQPWLIRTKRHKLHMNIGQASFVIVPLIVITGLVTTHEVLNRTTPVDPANCLIAILPFMSILTFGLCWGLAMINRKKRELHTRYIISTVFAIITAATFRIFIAWIPGFATPDRALAGSAVPLFLILGWLLYRDYKAGMKKSPYWVVFIAMVLMHVGFYTVARTEPWIAFCQAYANL